ncbi:hypothetical protein pEaSNUABM37_00236 [Erwinia phage pEa_SNUABM_37]|nr:hypothetical protein pEaSNUABM37_00236 [Erwinia phage pEa_SNUABM_37]QXO10704.1 hypothetical protein pEaSNUABM48_00236 [Erwinia phage pEa_SNUABM_48]
MTDVLSTPHIFKGKYIAITGVFELYTRYELQRAIKQLGGRVATVIDKRISFLLAGDDPGRRLVEAQRFGIRIVREDELIHLLGLKGHVSEIKTPDRQDP